MDRKPPRRQQEALAVAEQRSAQQIEDAVDRAALAKRIKAQLRGDRLALIIERWERMQSE
jgi:hypothetical protein